MTKLAIQVEDISKLYQLGTINSHSLKKDLYRWWSRTVHKENPYDPDAIDEHGNPSYIWALNKVSFEVKQGEVWGIVGGNGSGKSTLLKIISRIIRPTHGVVRGNGKLSSMLEVGTGFHHDLSGRENIYLSGSILGMKRQEIRQRFDEIVAFSGVEQFIDTPVKRYSSGMYVRLAFAVAAHLQSDILIVDEVLAVGDAEFQKKCLDKMQDYSRNEGRTILFVSHDLQMISHLCKQAIWLQKGKLAAKGTVQAILSQYGPIKQTNSLNQAWESVDSAPGNHWVRFKSIKVTPNVPDPDEPIDVRTPLRVQAQFWVLQDNIRLLTAFQVFVYGGECVFDVMSSFADYQKGVVEASFDIPGNFLNDGTHTISLVIYRNSWEEYYEQSECLIFDVEDHRDEGLNFEGKWWGAVRPRFPIQLVQLRDVQSIEIPKFHS